MVNRTAYIDDTKYIKLVGVNKAQGLFTRYSYWEFCCRKNTPRRELEDWTSPWHWCRFISFVFTFAREVGGGDKGTVARALQAN